MVLILRDNYDDTVYATLEFDSEEKRAEAIAVMDKVRESEDGWNMEDIFEALCDVDCRYYEDKEDIEEYYL